MADSTFLFFSLSSHKHCASSPSSGRRPTKCQEQRSKLEWNVSSESHAQSFPRTRVHCEIACSASTDVPETNNISDNHMIQVTQHTWDDEIVQSHLQEVWILCLMVKPPLDWIGTRSLRERHSFGCKGSGGTHHPLHHLNSPLPLYYSPSYQNRAMCD